MYEVDPKFVAIRVVRYQKRFLGECQYIIEIEFKNRTLLGPEPKSSHKDKFLNLPRLSNKRTSDDFEAFHMALSNKFKNIKFPELPKSSTLSFKAKINEKRCEVF
jgi:hypothetical protein